MEFRNMLDIFKGKDEPQQTSYYKMLNDYAPQFSDFNGKLYDSDICRACIDVIAKNAAKLKPKHIRRTADGIVNVNDNLEYLLTVRPNEYMSAFDFLYKIVANLFSTNNAFIYIQTVNGKVVGFLPIKYSHLEMVEYGSEMYCKFYFATGFKMTVPYSDMIHLRRHYNRNDIFGEDGTRPFAPTLNLMQTINQGIINAIKSSARLRGLLKFTGITRPEDMEAQRKNFVEKYLSVNNDGGIGAIDTKADFVAMDSKPQIADAEQMKTVKENAYQYFGVNEKIIKADYSEDEWNAFYESVIEPIAIQLSLECTAKIFTEREMGHGNEIIFEANRLQYVSTKTKIALIQQLSPLGLLTINEGREIFNMAPVEGGEKRLISLNYVDAANQNDYQNIGGNKRQWKKRIKK